jgi:hypothetical protein
MAIMQNDHDTGTYLPPHAPILAKGDVLEGVNVPNPKLILQIDLEREESRLLSAAASAANLSTTRYIKQVALAAARAYQDEQEKQAS